MTSRERGRGMNCTLCSELVRTRRRICWGEEFITTPTGRDPEVMAIAEAPGEEEDRSGRPIVGTSGQEGRHHLMLNGIANRGVWLDNVIKCRPLDNRNPTAEEIRNCTEAHLTAEILSRKPKWIITMGRVSTQWLLGDDINMELAHGVPRTIYFHGFKVVVIPSYHPAAGLHDPNQMLLFHTDMQVAGDVIRGLIHPHPPTDEWEGKEDYRLAEDAEDLERYIGPNPSLVAVDTEWARGRMWCSSVSVAPGSARVIMADQQPCLSLLNEALSYGQCIAAIHNALYDLPVLASVGIHPPRVVDTMVAAYLLQSEPQGLKPLAYRHCGMEMSSYEEMVADATHRLALEYLEAVMEREWPDPPPVLEWAKGEPKVRQPQNVARKVAAALKKGDDLYGRWKRMGDTEQVEAVMGMMQQGELCDVPVEDAVHYSARDADATIRVYPILWERILSLGLEGTLSRDMRAMPMVVDMMAAGMPVNLAAFSKLSAYLQKRMDLLQRKMQYTVGKHLDGKAINPASSQQMATLIYDRLKLHEVGGRYRSKKGAANHSTADDILKRYIGLHPVVEDIIDWRGYQKLKTSYADAIPKMVSPDGRIRTTIRMTRVATGRLSSSNPNLMAQPVRSEEGRMVRDCYEAPSGHVLVSGDYSQVEMRVAADGAKDERMMSIFWSGEDIHSVTASDMFGVPRGQLDEMKHRYPAKRVGFGILNLITAEGLQRELAVGGAGGWTLDDCKGMIRSWFAIYPGVAAYMKANGEQAKRYGYVRDMWGRIRYIPGIRSTNRWIRMEAERQAGNAPIQMGAQGIIKEAMGRLVPLYREVQEEMGYCKPLIQIHDDIVWEMEEWMPTIIIPQIRGVMIGVTPRDFIVPLGVDFKSGTKWGSMDKIR